MLNPIRRFNAGASALAAGISLIFCGSASSVAAPVVGQPAPALAGQTIGGALIDVAQWRGKVVLVNYWATWCIPCRREMPILEAFYRANHDKGLELISISVDFARDIDKVREAMTSLSYPVAHIKGLDNDGFGKPPGVPITYLIDRQGIVREKFVATPEKLLNDVVVPLLAEK